jgi:hypothetical protein
MESLNLGDRVMCSGFFQRTTTKSSENNYQFIKKGSFEGVYIGQKTIHMKTSTEYQKIMFSDYPDGPLNNCDEYYRAVGKEEQKVAIVVNKDKYYFVPFNKIIKMRY